MRRRQHTPTAAQSVGRRRFDHDAALAAYVALGPQRSFGKIARQFGVSDVTISKVARRDNWDAVAAKTDRDAATKALRAAVKSREDRNLEVLGFVDEYVQTAKKRLANSTLEVRAGDIPGLVKLAELLEGEATERVDVGQVQQVLVVVLNTALRFVPPSDREGFLEAFDRDARALLDPSGQEAA